MDGGGLMQIVLEWAGQDRVFALSFGGVLDLEQAAGDAIGVIFQRVKGLRYRAADVFHTIRLGLIGGGMDMVEAKRLLSDRFDEAGYMRNAVVALNILTSIMVGVEAAGGEKPEGEPAPIKFSEVSQVCQVFNMSPLDLRAMRFADFANMMRGFNAKGGAKAEPMTEAEFEEMMAKYHDPAARIGAADGVDMADGTI